ncbi:MAG: rhodanese-like domain-containing protein [Dehalococcoidia bacterium]
MQLIDRDELKKKIDSGDDFKLVMVLSAWAFKVKHIPGSIQINDPPQAMSQLKPSDEIVVYCSDEGCSASKYAYHLLTSNGFSNVRRYAGGIADWEANGLPLEGDWAESEPVIN